MTEEIEGIVDELSALFAHLLRAGRDLSEGQPALTATQRLALLEAAANGPLRLGALAARMGTTAPTASRAVDALVEAGLIARVVDPADRRAVLVDVTRRGRVHVTQRRAAVADALAGALSGVGAEDRRRLLEQLETLNAGLAERRPAVAGEALLTAG